MEGCVWNEMAAHLKTNLNHGIHAFNPELLDSEPLTVNDLLKLLGLANEFGYSVKSAHDFESSDQPILAEIYSVWFAIEQELLIFAHNIPRLIQLTRIKNLEFTKN